MDSIWIAAISSVVTGLLSLLGVYAANRKSAALWAYRLEELEKKVDKHNHVVERTYKLEGRMTEAEHEIADLKKGA